MSEAKIITVDGVECRQVVAPSEVRIVVLQRGWIVVGRGLTRRVAFVTPRRSYIDGEVVDMPDVHGAPVANLPVLRPRPE